MGLAVHRRRVSSSTTLLVARMFAVVASALVGVGVPTSGAWAAADFFVSSPGPYEGNRADDGTAELVLGVTNATDQEIRLRLETADASCTTDQGEPIVGPYSTADVIFSMMCDPGSAARTASLAAESVGGGEPTMTPSSIPLQYTLNPVSPVAWSNLWLFLAVGAPFALIGVLPPYLFWLRSPRGNPSPQPPSADSGQRQASEPGDRRLYSPWYNWRNLGLPLPGITSDWSFSDNWASSASLAAALFTTVFAGGDALDAIVGSSATSTLAVIAVAAALAAGIIGSGPIYLTICKRRYDDTNGIARHNIVGGVLLASFMVLLGASGLLLTAASVLALPSAWALAGATALVLLVYSWKSIPQTLALGLFGDQKASAML